MKRTCVHGVITAEPPSVIPAHPTFALRATAGSQFIDGLDTRFATPSPAGSTRGSNFPVDVRLPKMDARVKPAHDGTISPLSRG